MKRKPRQMTPSQLASVAALQAVADARAVPRCVLQRGKANMFLDGNPIVYGGAIERVELNANGDRLATGDAVVVVDHAGGVVCWGTYNPKSMYRVRALQSAWETTVATTEDGRVAAVCDVREAMRGKVRVAAALRADLGLGGALADDDDDDNRREKDRTDAYRLLNSEGDGLSGVCVDVYGATAVASVSAAWARLNRAEIVKALGTYGRVADVVWREDAKMLKLETGEDADADDDVDDDVDDDDESEGEDGAAGESPTATATDEIAPRYDAATGEPIAGESAPVVVTERGVKFEVDLARGHKTGFYVDQRENRAAVRRFASAPGIRKVMDVCCYTGGFAVNAALGGASDVTGVDSSRPALDVAAKNASLNGVTDRIRWVKNDAFKHLDACLENGEAGTYDLIVLDPPKLAPNVKSVARAVPKYVGMNQRAMKLLVRTSVLRVTTTSTRIAMSSIYVLY